MALEYLKCGVTEELNFKFYFKSFKFEESHMPSVPSPDLGSALSFQQPAQGLALALTKVCWTKE